SIDGKQTNEGVNHWGTLEAGAEGDHCVWMRGKTAQSGYGVAVMSSLIPGQSVDTSQINAENTLQPSIRVTCHLDIDQAATFDKFTAIHSTRDAADPLSAARA